MSIVFISTLKCTETKVLHVHTAYVTEGDDNFLVNLLFF